MGRPARKRVTTTAPYPSARGLYELTRALLGSRVSDAEIARRWRLDPRQLNDLKHGRSAVPRLERLRDLARVLGINEHFIYAVAAGAPVSKVLPLVRREDVAAAVGLLVGAATQAEDVRTQSERALAKAQRQVEKLSDELELRNEQVRSLVDQLSLSVLTLDAQGNVLHLNGDARELFGVPNATPGVPLIALLSGTIFLDLQGSPFEVNELPSYRALRTGQPASAVFSVHRPRAHQRIVAATATPMRAGDHLIGVVSVLRDIEDLLSSIGGAGARSVRRGSA
jgi:PAS domain-containing protein